MTVSVGFPENQVAGRNVDCAKTPHQTARAGARKVDMTFSIALHEVFDRVGSGTGIFPEAKQNVVVPVEYRLHA